MNITWSFKYLSVREIDPSGQRVSEPADSEAPTNISKPDSLCSSEYCELVISQHVLNDGSITNVSSVDLSLKKSTTRDSGTVVVDSQRRRYSGETP